MNTEDVLPQWFRTYAMQEAQGGQFTGTMASGSAFNAPVPFQVTVPVGEPCNTWMGEAFESPAKPVLIPLVAGVHHTLLPSGQQLVARWIAKTALMNALAHPPSPDLEVYQQFRATGDPPLGSRIHLGFYTSPGQSPTSQGLTFIPPEPGMQSATSVEFLPFHATLGRLVVVYSLSIHGPAVETLAEANGALLQIWPHAEGPFEWPPPIGLDVVEVGAAAVWRVAPG